MEDDLTWLARNRHDWPEGLKAVLNPVRFVLDVIPGEKHYTHNQWLGRRAKLQNKPSWNDAPEWANWLAQWNDGAWFWCGDEIDNPPQKGELGWYQDGETLHLPGGEVLGDWGDTLERRPESKPEFEQFVSIEDGGSIKAQVDGGWFERGELPPVGAECVAVAEGIPAEACKIIAYHKDTVAVQWSHFNDGGLDVLSMPGWEFRPIRPIRTERDEAIKEMKQHCPCHGCWDSVVRIYAEALYDAGYRKQEVKA